jgi:hypothetical protein
MLEVSSGNRLQEKETEMNEAITAGVPLVAIIAGILFNRQDVSSLRGEILSLRSEMNQRFDSMQRDMSQRFDSIQRDMRKFYAVQAQHDVRMQRLEHPAKH